MFVCICWFHHRIVQNIFCVLINNAIYNQQVYFFLFGYTNKMYSFSRDRSVNRTEYSPRKTVQRLATHSARNLSYVMLGCCN